MKDTDRNLAGRAMALLTILPELRDIEWQKDYKILCRDFWDSCEPPADLPEADGNVLLAAVPSLTDEVIDELRMNLDIIDTQGWLTGEAKFQAERDAIREFIAKHFA